VIQSGPVPGRTSGRLAAWLLFIGIYAALAYYGYATADDRERERDLFYRWEFFVLALVQFAFMLGVTLAIARGGPARWLLALKRPTSWKRSAGIMALTFLGVLVLSGAVVRLFDLDPGAEQGLVPVEWDSDRALPFAANFVMAALFAPLVEELLFRGLGFSLLQRFGEVAAIAATAILFGLAHGLVEALPVLIGFGIGLGILRSRSQSVYPCIVLHAVFNAAAILAAVLRNVA
jgi:membrane protease YdiL (CAAX protease family)